MICDFRVLALPVLPPPISISYVSLVSASKISIYTATVDSEIILKMLVGNNTRYNIPGVFCHYQMFAELFLQNLQHHLKRNVIFKD